MRQTAAARRGLGRLSRSLGTEVGWAKLLATLAGHGELRDYVEPHRVLWRCAWAQRVALERVLTAQLAAPEQGLLLPAPATP